MAPTGQRYNHDIDEENDSINTWVIDLLNDLRRGKFYGKVVFEMKEGNIVLVRREETIKPPSKDVG